MKIPDELSRELERVKDAVQRYSLAPRLPLVELVKDSVTKESDSISLSKNGIYFLFYPTGQLARVGIAKRKKGIQDRLNEYCCRKAGYLPWLKETARGGLDYRWVAVIAWDAPRKDLLQLENFLKSELKPPENSL
jgi:hypothetical protein